MRLAGMIIIGTLVVGAQSCSVWRWMEGKPSRQPINATVEEMNLDEKAILAEVDQLKNATLIGEDDEAEGLYDEAVHALTQRGSHIEGILIEQLNTSDNAGVRYGILNVLDAIGTRRSVEPIIETIMDPDALVAQKALFSIEAITGHQMVPETGVKDGIPAIPLNENGGEAEALQTFTTWHGQNGQNLYDNWTSWWGRNKDTVKIE